MACSNRHGGRRLAAVRCELIRMSERLEGAGSNAIRNITLLAKYCRSSLLILYQ